MNSSRRSPRADETSIGSECPMTPDAFNSALAGPVVGFASATEGPRR